jgi:hypothetical protein
MICQISSTFSFGHQNHKKILSVSQYEELTSLLKNQDISEINRRRIEIILLANEGKSQSEICKALNCTPATVNRWITVAKSEQLDQLLSNNRGCPHKVDKFYLERLKQLLNKSPYDFGYHFQQWSGEILARHLEKELGIKISKHHVNRLRKKIQPIQIKNLPLD